MHRQFPLRPAAAKTIHLCHSSNVVCEEFVLSSLIASPLIKPLFTPAEWQTKNVHIERLQSVYSVS